MSVTAATARGPRPYQEDRSVITVHGDTVLLAVLDGHGGADVAEHCALHLRALEDLPTTEANIYRLVRDLAIEVADHEAGSTLSLMVIRPDAAIVAVLGDSPVLMFDIDGRFHVGPEHNVRTNLAERKAAVARGGVYSNGYIWDGMHGPGLMMSRALGDVELRGILSYTPAVCTIPSPRWALITSDGALDPGHAETDALIDDVRRLVDDAATTADDVLAWAILRGLADNATALLWRRDV